MKKLCLMFAVGCSGKGEEIKREEAVSLLTNIDDVSIPDSGLTMEVKVKSTEGDYTVKVVYSKEPAIAPQNNQNLPDKDENSSRRSTPGSVSFVPSVVGLIIGAEVIKDLIKLILGKFHCFF